MGIWKVLWHSGTCLEMKTRMMARDRAMKPRVPALKRNGWDVDSCVEKRKSRLPARVIPSSTYVKSFSNWKLHLYPAEQLLFLTS